MEEKDLRHSRSSLLLGDDVMDACCRTKVIIFGVGGVGSWCAEGLLRSGIRNLTLVDDDVVAPSNLNRQLEATVSNLGCPKVEALRDRLLDIDPGAEIVALQKTYTAESDKDFCLDSYDYVIDAIDSLRDKMDLIHSASLSGATLFSSMGAACKLDPTLVRVAEFGSVRGCPLGSALRKNMRRLGIYPEKKFLCVYDEQVLPNLGAEHWQELDKDPRKKRVNGSLVHITSIFGMTLAGLVLQDIYNRFKSSEWGL